MSAAYWRWYGELLRRCLQPARRRQRFSLLAWLLLFWLLALAAILVALALAAFFAVLAVVGVGVSIVDGLGRLRLNATKRRPSS